MIWSVSKNGIEWFLDFGPDSVTLTVKDLVQEMTIKLKENRLEAWSVLSQRQDFLNNHLSTDPFIFNQQGNIEMRGQVLSSVCGQNMDTSRFDVSDPEDVEFHRQGHDLILDAVFRPGIAIDFSPSIINDFRDGFNGCKRNYD